jgi:hypothetical protein
VFLDAKTYLTMGIVSLQKLDWEWKTYRQMKHKKTMCDFITQMNI